jgi:acyl-CoA synthetase (AMP-forming)/AMP-acid ligase II
LSLLSHSQSPPATHLLAIPQLLIHQAEHAPDARAILAPGRHPLTYGRLRKQISDVGMTLYTIGVSRNDRVALVLPDGPEMAVAFLAVAASATSAPLNPTYSADEFAK